MGGAGAVGYPSHGAKRRRFCGGERGGDLLRHSADEEAGGGGVDHRLRRGWGRADAQHGGLRERRLPNRATEVWLTGAFNLTSHMTFFLAKGAVIKATQDTMNWPLIVPLPSYGRGRELPGGRYMSLIHGNGLQDVIIRGENGTIDGQGVVWWNMWKQRTPRFT